MPDKNLQDQDLYKVVLSGTINPHADRARALAGFQKAFSLDAEKIEKLFSGKPSVIKKGLDKSSAERYLSVITKIGGEATIESMAEAPATINLQKATAEPEQVQAPEPVSEATELASEAPSNLESSTPVPPNPVQSATVLSIVKQPEKNNTEKRDMPGYQFEFEGQPDYAFVTIQVPANEVLKVEASAMATMDTHINMKTKLRGGLGRFVTGESIFLNEFVPEGGAGEIGVAPGAPGDMDHVYLDGADNDTIYLQNSAYVASTEGVAVETKWQGLTKGFFSGESLFLIRCQGTGDLWFSSYGGIINIDVDGDYVVDTGNIVAFTEGLDYKITKVGGYKSLFFSGEGFVCRFSGKGKVWIQTRKPGAFIAWASPFRPVKRRG